MRPTLLGTLPHHPAFADISAHGSTGLVAEVDSWINFTADTGFPRDGTNEVTHHAVPHLTVPAEGEGSALQQTWINRSADLLSNPYLLKLATHASTRSDFIREVGLRSLLMCNIAPGKLEPGQLNHSVKSYTCLPPLVIFKQEHLTYNEVL